LLLKTIHLTHLPSIRQTPARKMSTPALPQSIARRNSTASRNLCDHQEKRIIKSLYRYPSTKIRKPGIRNDPERYQSCERRLQVPALEIQELKDLTFSLGVFTPPEIIKNIFNTI
jgi:hypothetical protein